VLPELGHGRLDPDGTGQGLDKSLGFVRNESYRKPVKIGLVFAKNVTAEPGKPANDEPGGGQHLSRTYVTAAQQPCDESLFRTPSGHEGAIDIEYC
jgi:hypothetical protein